MRSALVGTLSQRNVDVVLVVSMILIKILLFGVGMALVVLVGDAAPGEGSYSESADDRPLLRPWTRWDADHYTDIAVFGYRSTGVEGEVGSGGYESADPDALPSFVVYFPLFPWLIRIVDLVLRDAVVAALVVSTAASLVVGPLLYRLVAIDEGPRVALQSAALLFLFPTAYFLHIGYSESVFLAFVLGSFLAARTDRWWLAGLLGALAAATRANGLLLVPALAAEAVVQWWPHRTWRSGWLAIGLVPLGFLAYLGVNVSAYGDPFAFFSVQADVWGKSLSPPWVGLEALISSGLPRAWLPEVAFVLLGLVVTIAAALRFRPSWAIWMAGNWLVFSSTTFVLSVPRYSLILFPIVVWLALLARTRTAMLVIAGVSTLGMFFLASRFAVGLWAF
jgi:Gpi18-like mannosyltransferase